MVAGLQQHGNRVIDRSISYNIIYHITVIFGPQFYEEMNYVTFSDALASQFPMIEDHMSTYTKITGISGKSRAEGLFEDKIILVLKNVKLC